ncbi:MAG TPA: hypothetical protein VNB59_01995 [Solirubrobacterales bacterium]|jgi:hypothetical protein|nr:hypothetical protein [Solirubrobacterales bacterium]
MNTGEMANRKPMNYEVVFLTHGDVLDIAVERSIAYLGDSELEARYPNHTHFVGVDSPHYARLATKALLQGHSVVIVYPDGHELLIDPEPTGGARIEARDTSGRPIAA